MKQHSQETEPPSCLQYPMFMIGRNRRGNWVVQDQSGMRGGLFVDRAEALRFVRSENGNRPQAFVAVNGVLELDMNRASATPSSRRPAAAAQRERRVA